ncbi:hypothetical protein Tco_0013111 [Tanacetum coccineum]
MGCDENRMSINLVAAVFVAVSILTALKTEDLSRKLEVNYVKFQFRGGLLGLKDLSRAETYKWYQIQKRVSINMLVEKKYPLKKEILENMINLKIEAEEDSNMAIELIKFIQSHIAEQREDWYFFLGKKELLQDNAAEELSTVSFEDLVID